MDNNPTFLRVDFFSWVAVADLPLLGLGAVEVRHSTGAPQFSTGWYDQ